MRMICVPVGHKERCGRSSEDLTILVLNNNLEGGSVGTLVAILFGMEEMIIDDFVKGFCGKASGKVWYYTQ